MGNQAAIFTQERGFSYTRAEFYLQQNTYYIYDNSNYFRCKSLIISVFFKSNLLLCQGLKTSLLRELKRLQNALANILAKAQEHAKESLEEFVADKVRGMSAMIGHYFTTFQALGVMTRKDLEQKIGMLYNCEDVQDAAEDLFHAEDEWNAFLEDIDTKIKPMSDIRDNELVVGSYAPYQTTVTDVQAERLVAIVYYLLDSSLYLFGPLFYHPEKHAQLSRPTLAN